MKYQKVYTAVSALCALCVLLSLFIGGTGPISIGNAPAAPAQDAEELRAVSAAAIRYMPVFSDLDSTAADRTFAIDMANADQGFVAVKARSEENVKIKILSESGAERVYNVPNIGTVAYYPLSDGDGSYTVQLLQGVVGERTDLYERVLESTGRARLLDEFQPYIRPSTYVWFSGHARCVSEAAALCAGVTDDDEKIERIRGFVIDTLRYDAALAEREDLSFIRDPDVILARGTGVCLDYAVLTAAMLRSQGIPAKVVYGEVSSAEGLHAWNMAYTASAGWQRLDTTFADQGAEQSFIDDDANYTDKGWY